MVLASVGATRLATTTVDPMLKDVITVPPTAIREFDQRDTLTVVAEIYDNRNRETSPVRLMTTVTDAAGRVIHRSEESIEAFGFDPKTRTYRHHPSIALTDFAPGDYVVKVEAQPMNGERSVAREVLFTVRPAPPAAAD
jgi:hypothetical protein